MPVSGAGDLPGGGHLQLALSAFLLQQADVHVRNGRVEGAGLWEWC